MTKRRTCDHEAAHAVLAERYGERVRRVIVSRCRGGKRGWLGFTDPEPRQRVHAIPSSVVSLAGSVAEHLWHGEEPNNISGGDYKKLLHLGMPMWSHMEKTPRLQRAWMLLFRLTLSEVRLNRCEIKRVSRALYRRGKLSGDEVRAILGKR